MKKASAVLRLSWLILVVCGLLSCGQKGPLYLPQSAQPAPKATKQLLFKKQVSSANEAVSSAKSSVSSDNLSSSSSAASAH